ncbi:MAG: YidC/Oxa1 family membrane protein insertase [Anaerovoracaceae bacterium]|jgi:YidC/Oxa1 family membrane protein insertase
MTTYEKVLGILAEPLGWVLSNIYNLIGNYGITLIVFTLVVRACLLPLYAAQMKSSMKMQEVQPKVKEIQKKYANNKQVMNEKMMELYREEKFNPAGGCLPMLVQMPIILALFVLLRNPVFFMKSDQMIMAVHENFLWIPDLSQADPWVMPLLAAIATFFSFSLTQALSPSGAAMAGQAGMMKVMKYFFPIMLFWMAHSFPAGLALYWFIGTTFQIGQLYVMKKYRERKG